jgi:hypothetical protein
MPFGQRIDSRVPVREGLHKRGAAPSGLMLGTSGDSPTVATGRCWSQRMQKPRSARSGPKSRSLGGLGDSRPAHTRRLRSSIAKRDRGADRFRGYPFS